MNMGFSFFSGIQQDNLLDTAALQRLSTSAQILEQDPHGVKVLRLPDGDMLKIFRMKRLISSARIFSYAQRFCRNARRLQKLGIPTVSIKKLYRFSDSANSAVLYAPLPGRTIRELAREGNLQSAYLMELGAFIARLHELGVYFRSLHLGNVVLCPTGQLGLIDVADMRILPWKLSCNRRLRNFRHMHRLKDDIAQLGQHGWLIVLESYLRHCGVSKRCASRLKSIDWQIPAGQGEKGK